MASWRNCTFGYEKQLNWPAAGDPPQQVQLLKGHTYLLALYLNPEVTVDGVCTFFFDNDYCTGDDAAYFATFSQNNLIFNLLLTDSSLQ